MWSEKNKRSVKTVREKNSIKAEASQNEVEDGSRTGEDKTG